MLFRSAFTAFAVIITVEIAVWLITLLIHRRVFRPDDPANPQVFARGELEIDAPIEDVWENTLATLRGGLQGVGSVLIKVADDSRIAGEVSFSGSSRGPTGHSPIGRGMRFDVEFEALGSRTLATYRIIGTSGGCLQSASALFVYFLIPAVLAVVGIVILTFVVGSENPDTRYQVFQTFQIIHILWPPFLFMGLRGRVAGVVTKALRDVLSNAAF